MEIVQATLDDLEGVAGLFDEYRMYYEQPSDIDGAKAYIKERLLHEESVIFVAKKEGQFVGFTQLYPVFSSISMKRAWILNDLFVDEAVRKQGAGELLPQRAKELAVATGAKSIVLETAADNTGAQKLYERNGYVRDTEFLHYELGVEG